MIARSTLAAVLALFATTIRSPLSPSNAQESPATQPATEPSAQPASPATPSLGNPDAIAGGLRGSKHDFSGPDHSGELCRSCHNAHLPNAPSPLLDRRPASTQPLRAYQAIGIDLNSASLKCVSCHDGVIAPDVFNGAHSMRSDGQLGIPPVSGQSGGHPVGIRYPDGKSKFRPLAAVLATDGIKLPDERIQCVTCHDPHNARRIRGFLVTSNDRSRLCLTCHQL